MGQTRCLLVMPLATTWIIFGCTARLDGRSPPPPTCMSTCKPRIEPSAKIIAIRT
ncbi:hypothetical protein JG687_00014079 [Phytophthora cactorum]|uniref:Lipoprotein n=1 Tax=Phytophthora cactorum TaxID=29920 RepID=A0A8T1TZN9_9STRA|nr:hypothetical protein JG687_00014079 [Phytophthora cactorum]